MEVQCTQSGQGVLPPIMLFFPPQHTHTHTHTGLFVATWQVPGLASACEAFMNHSLRPATAPTFLDQAIRLGLLGVCDSLLAYSRARSVGHC